MNEPKPPMTTDEAVTHLQEIVQRFVLPLQHLAGALTAAQAVQHDLHSLTQQRDTLAGRVTELKTQIASEERNHGETIARMDAEATARREAEEGALRRRIDGMEARIRELEPHLRATEQQAKEAESDAALRIREARAAAKQAEEARDAVLQQVDTLGKSLRASTRP